MFAGSSHSAREGGELAQVRARPGFQRPTATRERARPANCGFIRRSVHCEQRQRGCAVSAARLTPHLDAPLVEAQCAASDVCLVLKLIDRDRLLADVAALAAALATEVLLWWLRREW